jgi:serine/threonine protein kinase
MEYLEGSSLQERIKRGPVPRDEAVALVIRVAEAVQHAHEQGFVHRDLKPSNILFNREGKPCVADFGLAVHESTQRKLTGEYSGTLPYMSPEQVRGETHHLDGRSDIWSIGVIFYELLAGRRPFNGETGDELRDEILNREPKPLRQVDASIPAELERVCLKCLAKPVTSRYNSASELADDLRNCVPDDGARIGAMPAPVSPLRQFMAQANVGRMGCGLTVTLASLLFVLAMIAPSRLKQQVAIVATPETSVATKATGDDVSIAVEASPDDPAPPDMPSPSELAHVPTAIERVVPDDPDQRNEWQRN